MKRKSTWVLLLMLGIDAVVAAGAAFLVYFIKSGARTQIPAGEAIQRISTIAGAAIGGVTGFLIVLFIIQRRRGN